MKTISHLSGLIGDSICAFPAIQAKAAIEPEGIALWMDNKDVQGLLPENPKIKLLTERPETPDYVMEAGPVFSKFVYTHHMRQGYFSCVDLPVPHEVPSIKLRKSSDVFLHDFDILISPFSRSDHNHNKKWYDDRWYEVTCQLTQLGYRILVVGSDDDQMTATARIFHTTPRNPADPGETLVYGLYGMKLGTLINMIERAKLCITLDNGISHLVSATGVDHLLLYPGCLPFCWVSNPNNNAHHIHKTPIDLAVADVMSAATELLGVPF